MLPIAKYGFELSMQHFWGSISLRYGWDISKFPTCPCGSKFDIQHSMSCKKGGFATIRHNKKWDLIVKVLSEVSNNTKIEPKLLPLCGENWGNRTANRSNEVRLDVETHGFWERGEEAFFWFKGVWPQRLPISKQIAAAMSGDKRKWEEKGI